VCTLILGIDVVAPRSVILAANRDEAQDRPTDPPGVLGTAPALAGGRDRVAGGTWLAVRERRAAVAMLNRRERASEPETGERVSRGRLALEVAALQTPTAARALELATQASFAPFSLVYAAPGGCWMISREAGEAARSRPIGPGWHVLTHTDLDDPKEPRAAAVLDLLRGQAHASQEDSERMLKTVLADHGHSDASGAVCIHEGKMVTVSSSLVWLAPGEARYLHAEGRPCERPFIDRSDLLAGAFAPEGEP
jgi:uncharacterized protein with NRDE domain